MDIMERINKEKKFWEKHAKKYDRKIKIKNGILYNEIINLFLDEIRHEDSVLEMACGTGTVALQIARKAKKVTGIDISQSMLQKAFEKAEKMNIRNVDFHLEDGYKTSFPDQSFDVIVCCNVLHVIREPERMLQEARRLLKKDGVLLSSTDCYAVTESFRAKINKCLTKILLVTGQLPFLHNFTPDDLILLFEDSGYQLLKSKTIEYLGLTGFYIAAKTSETRE